MYCYEIGGIGFGFDTCNELYETENYGIFRIDEIRFNKLPCRHIYTFEQGCPQISGSEVFRSGSFTVYENKESFIRVTERFDEIKYKCIFIEKKNQSGGKIYFTDGGYEKLKTVAELFRIIDMISAFLYFDAFMFHSSVLSLGGRGLLFSGVSGIGKSTQADLWKKYENAEIINGDRAVIRLVGDEWIVYGNPASGSSDICLNSEARLETVVFLKQGNTNTVREINKIDSFMRLFSQITCGTRKGNDGEKIVSLAEKLAQDIKILELECTVSREAVDALKEKIGD